MKYKYKAGDKARCLNHFYVIIKGSSKLGYEWPVYECDVIQQINKTVLFGIGRTVQIAEDNIIIEIDPNDILKELLK